MITNHIERVYSNITTIHPSDYTHRVDYILAYRDMCRHYEYKVRVEGGWKFFEFRTDYDQHMRTK